MNKSLVKAALAFCLKPIVAQISKGTRIPILCYHSVNASQNIECDPIHPELFEEHLRYLKANYTVVSLRSALKHLLDGDILSPDAVVITFDDGYRDNYEVVFPLLKKYEIPATIFVVTDFINNEVDLIEKSGWEAMNWSQVQEMDRNALIDIGLHTKTHSILSELTESEIIDEIEFSNKELQIRLDREIDLFAYPNGQGRDIPKIALDTVKRLGFLGSCSTFWSTKHKASQRFIINRVMIFSGDSIKILKSKLLGHFDYIYFLHKSRAIFDAIIRKKGIWK